MLGSGSPLEWIVFAVIVLGMLALDLIVFNRKAHEIHLKEAALWSVVWIAISLIFNGYVWHQHGPEDGAKFLAAYLVEKSLSVDNLFVFLAIFGFFKIPAQYQHRVLFWGVLSAIVLRAIFIGTGTALLTTFHWMMYIFGAFLVYTGVKLGLSKSDSVNPADSWIMRFATKRLRFTPELHGTKFFIKQNGIRLATPLFMVLVVIEFTDVVFAFDSVPAVLGISTDLFIVYASNIFAILGLRALYFLLAGIMLKMRYLHLGLAMILVFIGLKMIAEKWVHVPIQISLIVILCLLLITVIASLAVRKKDMPSPNE